MRTYRPTKAPAGLQEPVSPARNSPVQSCALSPIEPAEPKPGFLPAHRHFIRSVSLSRFRPAPARNARPTQIAATFRMFGRIVPQTTDRATATGRPLIRMMIINMAAPIVLAPHRRRIDLQTVAIHRRGQIEAAAPDRVTAAHPLDQFVCFDLRTMLVARYIVQNRHGSLRTNVLDQLAQLPLRIAAVGADRHHDVLRAHVRQFVADALEQLVDRRSAPPAGHGTTADPGQESP